MVFFLVSRRVPGTSATLERATDSAWSAPSRSVENLVRVVPVERN